MRLDSSLGDGLRESTFISVRMILMLATGSDTPNRVHTCNILKMGKAHLTGVAIDVGSHQVGSTF